MDNKKTRMARRALLRQQSIERFRALQKQELFRKLYNYYEVVSPETAINAANAILERWEKLGRIDEYGNLVKCQMD